MSFQYEVTGFATQTVVPTVQLGVVYALMVDIGVRNDAPGLGVAALEVNGNTYTATGDSLANPGWYTYTATYIGQAADVGAPITIKFTTTGIQGNFDNVRLDAAAPQAVPEPASLLLFGTGLVVVVSRWRVRRSNR